MEPVILKDFPCEIDRSKIAEKMRLKPESSYFERFLEIFQNAQEIAKPKAIYKEITVEESGVDWVSIEGLKLKSRIVKVNLEETPIQFVYVATCGEELEEWSSSFTDMIEIFWLDAIKEEYLYAARNNLEKHLKEKYQLAHLSEMNPGSLGDWPISEQKNVFSLLNPAESIGVQLTDTFLMHPVKSTSGILFDAPDYENCQLCKKDCPSRKAPYNPHLYEQKYKIMEG